MKSVVNLAITSILILTLAFRATLAAAGEAQIAVAANFSAPMKQILSSFEQQTGHRVRVSYGSTGKLYAQINNGAPFEALLAADRKRPIRLEEEGLALPGTRFTYAIGTLLLWSAEPGLVEDGPALLKQGAFDRLAIANPRLAPYGEASDETLQALGLKQALQSKLVTGENIAQTYQFVDTGNARIGFVALAQVMRDGLITKGSGWIVPKELHRPIRQDAVILVGGKDNPVITELFAYLGSDKGRAIIQEFGYRTGLGD